MLAGGVEGDEMSLLARAELGLLAAQAAPGLGDLHALAGAHADQVGLELGDHREHVEQEPADRIGRVVHRPAEVELDLAARQLVSERPGLRQALAACRGGDTLVVAKLDRLARSLPDARAIADELAGREVKLNLGGSVHDPTDPVGRLLFNVLAMVAEFESDLIRMRTREGMKVAKARGRLRGKQPKLSPTQEAHLVALYAAGHA